MRFDRGISKTKLSQARGVPKDDEAKTTSNAGKWSPEGVKDYEAKHWGRL